MCDCLCLRSCVLCVCRLLSVVEVGCKEVCSGGGKVELVSKFVEEFLVGDSVVGFGKVDVDGE